MIRLKAAFIVLVLSLTAGPPLKAQEQDLRYFQTSSCDVAPKMIDLITTKYGESLLFVGNGMTFEARSGSAMTGGLMFYTNQDTGTFSILQVFADGVACMIMTGKDFQPWMGD